MFEIRYFVDDETMTQHDVCAAQFITSCG